MTIAILYCLQSGTSFSTVGPGTGSAASYQRWSWSGQKYGPLKISCRHRIWTSCLSVSWIIGRCFSNIAVWTSATLRDSSLIGLEAWIRPLMTLRAMGSSGVGSVGDQGGGFLRDIAFPGLGVARGARPRRLLGVARGLLAIDEVVVGREERQALADEVAQVLELVIGHELRQLGLELVDDLVAAQHRAGADLHGRCAEQEELRRVAAGLDAAEAADRDAGVGARDLHDLAQRDRPHRLARVPAGDAVALDGGHRPQGLEVDADHRQDGVDHRDSVGAAAQRGT